VEVFVSTLEPLSQLRANSGLERNGAGDESRRAAVARVNDYLRDAGLADAEFRRQESERIVSEAAAVAESNHATGDESLSETAIRLAVRQLELRLTEASSAVANGAQRADRCVAASLPKVLDRYTEFARRGAPQIDESLRSNLATVVPQPRPKGMRKQVLSLLPVWLGGRSNASASKGSTASTASKRKFRRGSSEAGTRLLIIAVTLLTSFAGVASFYQSIAAVQSSWIAVPLTALFAILFSLVAFSFWIATVGLVAVVRQGKRKAARVAEPDGTLPPTAVLMPVYNEDPRIVSANLYAIARSLQATGHADRFHLLILSDTTDPDVWLEEERTWAELATTLDGGPQVFYRHRVKNESRKAGNIADFCRRWGAHYKFMVVLDADSVMAGETIVELVRRMERDAEIGILQTPPVPVNRRSLFARTQQFAARVYGPVFLEGFAKWSQCDGNYWGHNAIIRVQAFMSHCDLPVLSGDGPLGGEILSHDFVEAALMRRAGYKVCLAHDLEGSYEECPTTMLGFAERDQRWCQGNLQHVRLLLAEGFHPMSRLHMGLGAMSYLSSPLWFSFLVLSLLAAAMGGTTTAGGGIVGGIWLFGVSMALLLLPKLWGVIALLVRSEPDERRGVWRRAGRGVVIEVLVSMLTAPIMMLLHTRFVVSTLSGMKVTWNAQQRSDSRVTLADALSVHLSHTICGMALAAGVAVGCPSLLPWLLPILIGLVCSVPLSMLLGSVRVGRALAERGLLLIPEEVQLPPVLQLQHDALARGADADRSDAATQSQPAADPFVTVLSDPHRYGLHVGIVRATDGVAAMSAEDYAAVRRQVAAGGAASVPAALRRSTLSDVGALQNLHVLLRSR